GGDAIVGIPAVLRLADLLRHGPAHVLRRHAVVLADPEVEQQAIGMIGERLTLGALDLLELVDLGALAVVGAADAVGEQGLEVRVAHRRRFYTAAATPARLGPDSGPCARGRCLRGRRRYAGGVIK